MEHILWPEVTCTSEYKRLRLLQARPTSAVCYNDALEWREVRSSVITQSGVNRELVSCPYALTQSVSWNVTYACHK